MRELNQLEIDNVQGGIYKLFIETVAGVWAGEAFSSFKSNVMPYITASSGHGCGNRYRHNGLSYRNCH